MDKILVNPFTREALIVNDCGTGSGGFKAGNTCAKGEGDIGMTLQNLTSTTIQGKNLKLGYSLESGELSSVALVEKTSDAKPNNSGWLKEYPAETETEEFKLADATAYLAIHAPGYGRLKSFDLLFDSRTVQVIGST